MWPCYALAFRAALRFAALLFLGRVPLNGGGRWAQGPVQSHADSVYVPHVTAASGILSSALYLVTF